MFARRAGRIVSGRQRGPVMVAVVTCALLAGCNQVKAPMGVRAGAPGLEDSPLGRGAGSNPNAPFAVLEPVRHLARREAVVDPGMAEPCVAAQLSAYESGAEVTGDERRLRVALVNHGDAACRLSGVPAVTMVAADGAPLGSVRVEAGGGVELVGAGAAGAEPPIPSAEVVLPAKGESEFAIAWRSGVAGADGCAEVAALAVAAPGTTRSFAVQHPLVVCGGQVTVSAVGAR